jgi:hypothetical protein
VQTGGSCLKASVDLLAAYAAVGVSLYTGQTAVIGLMTGTQGLANTLHGDQGQGPSAKRATIDAPLLEYGVSNISDSNIDLMNHAIALAREQKPVKTDIKLMQSCSNNNGNLYQGGHYFIWSNAAGVKIQCKPGCRQGG